MNPEQKKGADGTCETMRVVADNDEGFAVINKSDFNEKVHEAFESDAEAAEAALSKKPEEMTQKELSAHLTKLEIPHNVKAKKGDLLALVPAQ